MNEQTPAAVAPVPAEGTPAPAPSPSPTLAEWRAARKTETPAVPEPAPAAPAPEPPQNPLAGPPEPPEPPDEPEPEAAKGPEPAGHRWKDPDSGVTLDLRRRDHRRIKRLLEERATFASQLRQGPALPAPPLPQSKTAAPEAATAPADPRDPEPTYEQFADAPDPNAAYLAAVGRWNARQEIRHHEAQRAAVEHAQRYEAHIASRQSAWDAKLPEVQQRYPDFDAAYTELFDALASQQQRSKPFVQYLLTSPVGHDIAYYLGQHPEEVQRLFAHPTLDAHLRAIGAIEARVQHLLEQAHTPAPPVKPAPAPIPPVGGSATPTSYDARTADLATFRRKHGVLGGRAVARAAGG